MKRSYECGSAEHLISRRQALGTLAGAAIGGFGLSSLMQEAVAAEMKKQGKQVLFEGVRQAFERVFADAEADRDLRFWKA